MFAFVLQELKWKERIKIGTPNPFLGHLYSFWLKKTSKTRFLPKNDIFLLLREASHTLQFIRHEVILHEKHPSWGG